MTSFVKTQASDMATGTNLEYHPGVFHSNFQGAADTFDSVAVGVLENRRQLLVRAASSR